MQKTMRITFILLGLFFLPSFVSAHGIYNGHAGRFARGTVATPIAHYPYDPFWGSGWGYGYGYYSAPYVIDTRGSIRIKDYNKNDEVYLNGSYAGVVDDLSTIRLEPGNYNIKIIRNGNKLVDRDVYVVSGKKIRIGIGNNGD
jgi:hypothetical protein